MLCGQHVDNPRGREVGRSGFIDCQGNPHYAGNRVGDLHEAGNKLTPPAAGEPAVMVFWNIKENCI